MKSNFFLFKLQKLHRAPRNSPENEAVVLIFDD